MSQKRKLESADDSPLPEKKLTSRKQPFLKAYNIKWPFLTEKGPSVVYCTLCNVEFTCAHGGRNDCERHVKSKTHALLEKSSRGTTSIKTLFNRSVSDDKIRLQRQTTYAEVQLCALIAQENLPLSLSDKLTSKLKEIFPDSKIAQGLQCCRKKSTVIIKELSAMSMKSLVANMKTLPFSLATDGSNEGDKKQFPLVIRTFDVGVDGSLRPVQTQLLAIKNCEGSATGENIFNLIDTELKSQGVSWRNCISFGSDNAAVMVGQQKGVFSFIKKRNPEVYLAACTLHLVHIAAKKGASCLPPIEENIIDIFFFLKKSTLRQDKLRELQELFDIDQQKMLKHGCTRWLSIGRCINRLLQNWDPLKSLIKDEVKKKKEVGEKKMKVSSSVGDEEYCLGVSVTKLDSMYLFLQSPNNKLFTLFLSYTVKIYDVVLVRLQAEEPLIHKHRALLLDLLTSIFSRFLRPTAVLNLELAEVQFQLKENQKYDEELLIGDAARRYLAEADKHHLKSARISDFYASVRQYFVNTCQYLIKKLPLSDSVLKHVSVIDPANQTQVSFTDLNFFLQKFPCLLPPGATIELLEEQFSTYQFTDVKDCLHERVDEQWVNIGNRHKHLSQLARVMLGIATIPHSSAACERVFSCVRKNLTTQRASLSSDTLEALLVFKAAPLPDLSDDKLDRLKSAYSLHQQEYKH